jgi:hypothetical protein
MTVRDSDSCQHTDAELEKRKTWLTQEGIDPTESTCHNCDKKRTCLYSYDLYNTNDDCLASK